MTARIFIDGEAGTTGLQIRARLDSRADVEVASLPDDKRKDPVARASGSLIPAATPWPPSPCCVR